MTAARVVITGGATPAEAAAAVACVELMVAEQRAAAAALPADGRSPWWREGLAAALHHLPGDADAPIGAEPR